MLFKRIYFYAQVDWEAITTESEDNITGYGNLIEKVNVTGACPTKNSCRGCDPKFCWSAKHCQKFETGQVPDCECTYFLFLFFKSLEQNYC